MKQPIVGLLPVDPHRLHVYWDAPARSRVFLRIQKAEFGPLEASGSRYIENLGANGSYRAALYANGKLLARSNGVTLPPGGPGEPARRAVEIPSASR